MSVKECNDHVTDANADDRGNPARQLERVVEHVLADTCSAGGVEVDGSQTDEVVEASGCLQCSRGRDDRRDDKHHIDGYLARMHPEDKYQDEHAYHAVDAQSDASDPGTDKDQDQNYCKLY